MKEVFREGKIYDHCITIIRYFERILNSTGIKFGIITPSTLDELNHRKASIILKKLEQKYSKDPSKFNRAINEISALLNKVDSNLKRNLRIFNRGKAYASDKRVEKIFKRVNTMYDSFVNQSKNLLEDIKKKVSNHINNFCETSYRSIEGFEEIEIAKEMALQSQILRLNESGSEISDEDKNILSEIIYERKRFIQENHTFKNNLDFFFITEDTHFSPKYNKQYDLYSKVITDKIEKVFDIKCLRALQFLRMINKDKLNVSK